MDVLVGLLPAAACVGGMFLCMRMMHGGSRHGDASATERGEDVASLREEVVRLREQVAERDEQPAS